MSVVATRVLKDEIVIGADSISVSGYTQWKDKDAKIFQTENGITIGGCGLAEQTVLFKIFCDTHNPKAATTDDLLTFFAEFEDWIHKRTGNNSYAVDNSFHLIYQGKAFTVERYFIKEITDYDAIGAGRDFALAALFLGKSVEDALEAATELSVYCEKPLNLFRIPKQQVTFNDFKEVTS